MNSKYSHQYYLPKIRSKYFQQNQQDSKNSPNKFSDSKAYSKKSKILYQFQKQLDLKKNFKTLEIPSKKNLRNKTEGHEQNLQFLKLKKQLLNVKDSLSNKIVQHNHKLQLKMIQLSSLMSQKNSKQLYQAPIPMYIPIMQPFNQYFPNNPNNPNYEYNNVPENKFRTRNVSKKHYKKARVIQNLRKFRIRVHAILFTIYLRKFVERIVQYRKQAFNRFLNDSQFKGQVNNIKSTLIQSFKDFFQVILQKQETEFKILQNDPDSVKKQKKIATRKLVNSIIQALYNAIKYNNFTDYATPIYYFCKHGSFACTKNLLTLQELQNMSISSKHSYLQAEKNLQKSQIINFIFMKILIFNILAQPFKVDPQAFSNKPILQDNILLISSIFYQILMDIQDDYTVSSPICYVLGNFNDSKQKILPSASLTLKEGQYRKNQMISGFYNENYIKNIYKTEKTWIQQKNKLIQIIEIIHTIIVNYHKVLIKKFF